VRVRQARGETGVYLTQNDVYYAPNHHQCIKPIPGVHTITLITHTHTHQRGDRRAEGLTSRDRAQALHWHYRHTYLRLEGYQFEDHFDCKDPREHHVQNVHPIIEKLWLAMMLTEKSKWTWFNVLDFSTSNSILKNRWIKHYFQYKNKICYLIPNLIFWKDGWACFSVEISKIPVRLSNFHRQVLIYKHNFSPNKCRIWNYRYITFKHKTFFFFKNGLIVA